MTERGLRTRDTAAERRWRRRLRRLALIGVSAVGVSFILLAVATAIVWRLPAQPLIRGVIWQPTLDYSQPHGQWQQLGADTLLVQWLVSDGRAWRKGLGMRLWNTNTDWVRLRRAAWARHMVLGLAGDYDLAHARKQWRTLTAQSRRIAERVGRPPEAWYAPIEISPDWTDVGAIRDYLHALPRPLWVSVYRANDLSPSQFADWVQSWLPEGVRVLFQDGVGTGRSSPLEAASYARALIATLGRRRVGIVLEAFRPAANGTFEAAGFSQLRAQLTAYEPLQVPVYVFSCRYLGFWQVLRLKLYAWFEGWAKDARASSVAGSGGSGVILKKGFGRG